MNWQALQVEMTRITVFYIAVDLIAFIVAMLVLYYVIKCAIRDGIAESGLVGRWYSSPADARAKAGGDTLPPDMRAER